MKTYHLGLRNPPGIALSHSHVSASTSQSPTGSVSIFRCYIGSGHLAQKVSVHTHFCIFRSSGLCCRSLDYPDPYGLSWSPEKGGTTSLVYSVNGTWICLGECKQLEDERTPSVSLQQPQKETESPPPHVFLYSAVIASDLLRALLTLCIVCSGLIWSLVQPPA